MVIDENNYAVGNRGLASVLLLYYHLLVDGGITNDQTVYIDSKDFDGFSFLSVSVSNEILGSGIDEGLLREGATIYLLCDLNDIVGEYENDFLSHEGVKKIIAAFKQLKEPVFPEIATIINLFSVSEANFNYELFSALLSQIHTKYVVQKLKAIISGAVP